MRGFPLVLRLCLGLGLVLGSSLSGAVPAMAEGAAGLPPSVRIKPLMVPVINQQGRIEKYTQIEVNLEIGNAVRLGEVQVSMPRLHDAILTAVYKGIDEGWVVRGNIGNIPALRRKIDEAAIAMFGKDVITRILITPIARQSSFQ